MRACARVRVCERESEMAESAGLSVSRLDLLGHLTGTLIVN